MRRKSCTDDPGISNVFSVNSSIGIVMVTLVGSYVASLIFCSCTIACNRFRPFLYFGEDGFAWFSVSSTMSLAYTLTVDGEIRMLPDTWKPGFVWIVPSNTTGISFFIRLLYAASIDWGSKPTSEVVASNCFCMSLWIVFGNR